VSRKSHLFLHHTLYIQYKNDINIHAVGSQGIGDVYKCACL